MSFFASTGRRLDWLLRLAGLTVVTLMIIAVGSLGLRAARSNIEASIYRDRLYELGRDYESLRSRHNDAVRRTAVTELLVKDGRLTVLVRTAEGLVRQIDTPYDPRREVYVDFILADGRLWIRRIFDAETPPGRGLVIDPALGAVDWDSEAVTVGKAVYRRLGEGRWIVTVTGDGSLGLARSTGADEPAELTWAPAVREYSEVEEDARRATQRIGVGDLLRKLAGVGEEK